MSMDLLIEKIIKKKNPTVVGLDPNLDQMPPALIEKHVAQHGATLTAAAEAIYEFNTGLIDAVCELVPAVKPQSAYYEMYGPAGVAALARTMEYARAKGLYVIADCKRNDIGATAGAYANAYLGETPLGEGHDAAFPVDFVTVNAYLGIDGVKPFLEAGKVRGTPAMAQAYEMGKNV